MVKPLVRERHYRRSLFRKSVGIDLHGSADRGSVPESDLPRLRRLFNWRDALVVVRPETMVRRHASARPGNHCLRFPCVEIAAAQSQGQCSLRASHRHDSARVLGLADPPVRIAFAVHSEILDSALEHRVSPHGTRSGCSRSAARPSRSSNAAQFTPSLWRIVRRPRQFDPRRMHHEYFLAPACA